MPRMGTPAAGTLSTRCIVRFLFHFKAYIAENGGCHADPIDTPHAPKPLSTYAQGIEIAPGSRMVHVSGQVGVALTGEIPTDVARQHQLAWDNALAVLAAAGMDHTHIVDAHVYITDRAHLGIYREARDRLLKGPQARRNASGRGRTGGRAAGGRGRSGGCGTGGIDLFHTGRTRASMPACRAPSPRLFEGVIAQVSAGTELSTMVDTTSSAAASCAACSTATMPT